MEREIKLTAAQTRSAFSAAWARARKAARRFGGRAAQYFRACLKAVYCAFIADNFENSEAAEATERAIERVRLSQRGLDLTAFFERRAPRSFALAA